MSTAPRTSQERQNPVNSRTTKTAKLINSLRSDRDRLGQSQAQTQARLADADARADVASLRYQPGTRIPTPTEDRRLDDLTAYTSTILGHLHGDELDQVLAGLLPRRGRRDDELRRTALESVHPDDLTESLARHGMTLARFGIESIRR